MAVVKMQEGEEGRYSWMTKSIEVRSSANSRAHSRYCTGETDDWARPISIARLPCRSRW
jgi:hypothetical protein